MRQSKSSRARLSPWVRTFSDSATPVFLLDAKRRLLFFNLGCQSRTGWSSEDLVGLVCDYVSVADPHSIEAVQAACAPPAEVWHGKPAWVPVQLPHRKLPPQPKRIYFQPLLNAEQQILLVLGMMLPLEAPAPPISSTPAQIHHAELAQLKQQIYQRFQESVVIAQNHALQRALAQLAVASRDLCPVLFVGEAGTGREHLARVLHARGARSRLAFVPVDCRRTDHADLKRILKHLRHGPHESDVLRPGTVYLSEIEAAPRDVQLLLADWLKSPRTDNSLHILASTSVSLLEQVEEDAFERELYYLLSTLVIELPPLRKRMDDLLPLAQHFLESRNPHSEQQWTGFAPDAINELQRYHWPGNVAELQDVISTAVDNSPGPMITSEQLPWTFRASRDTQRLGPMESPRILPLETVLHQTEREHIQAALTVCRNNLTKAASLLGLSRPKLYRRMEALGLLLDNPADSAE